MNACARQSNARSSVWFRATPKQSQISKPAKVVIRIFCEIQSQEIFMPSSGKWYRMSRAALFFVSTIVLLPVHAALASQGPGGGPGTASSLTQLAMAIIVYGTSALVICGGLIGALRKR
jgi:hypothetical protein